MSEKKVAPAPTKIGGGYTPPSIRELPTVSNARGIVFFTNPLTQAQRISVGTCFRNFCTRHDLSSARIFIREISVTIEGISDNLIDGAFDFMEMNELPASKGKATASPKAKAPPPKQATRIPAEVRA